jgi:cytochrome c oxidase assembly protein subunit 11
MASTCIAAVGLMYVGVPFYRLFCQQTGFAGTPKKALELDSNKLQPVPGAKPVIVSFVADTSKKLPWKFVPEQKSITVIPGQTALAFYSAKNESDREIVGMATYSVVPARAAQYFNKIQCFCFEEQRLGPGEQVDMPVFFYLDPEFSFDPMMDCVQDIALGYSFFEAKN